jgi:hypothetical protein
MATRTVYAEVTPTDTDVAVFLCDHLADINVWNLPVKMWVARQDGAIVALMMLHSRPAVYLDLILAHPEQRPFMRILRLWQMAQRWLDALGVPLVCVTIRNELVHYQSLVRRVGFEPVGVQCDANGTEVETIYGRRLAA